MLLRSAARRSARSLQQSNGSLGISEASSEPAWSTPFALLAWNVLRGYEKHRKLAANWLLRKGAVLRAKKGDRTVHGHDTTIVGWPWTVGAHSWVEPTALAVLALRREGFGASDRVQDGLRLLRDRAVVTGGWNCGNKETFGRALRAQPAATGLALLALAHTEPSGNQAEGCLPIPPRNPAERAGRGVAGLGRAGAARLGPSA